MARRCGANHTHTMVATIQLQQKSRKEIDSHMRWVAVCKPIETWARGLSSKASFFFFFLRLRRGSFDGPSPTTWNLNKVGALNRNLASCSRTSESLQWKLKLNFKRGVSIHLLGRRCIRGFGNFPLVKKENMASASSGSPSPSSVRHCTMAPCSRLRFAVSSDYQKKLYPRHGVSQCLYNCTTTAALWYLVRCGYLGRRLH